MPPKELLLEAIDYNPDTGEMKWKERPLHHFASPARGARWNREWPNKPIGCRSFLKNGRKQYSQFSFTTKQHGSLFLSVHYVAWALLGKTVPDGFMLDHWDGDIWNNRRDNLRIATPLQNSWNARTHKDKKTSLPKNVFTMKNRPNFYARFSVNGKRIGLGCYPTPELASDAVRRAVEKHHGEFSNAG